MTSLFDSTKNPLFRLICALVNEIHAGAKLSRSDILNRILSLPGFHYNEAPETSRENQILDAVFQFPPPEHFAELLLEEPLPTLITDTELSWLKTMLLDVDAAFLLPPELRTKLLERLNEVPPLYDLNAWKKLRFVNPDRPPLNQQTLSLIVEALRQRRKILHGSSAIIPCALEYDFSTGEFFLIVWNENLREAQKSPVEKFTGASLSDESVPPDLNDRLRQFYSQHTAELSLLLRNRRNAVERCFALFGSCDKTSRYQKETDTYFLTVRYYDFEENELLEKILSLGAAVTVTAPQPLRQKIIQRLRDIRSLYAD